MPIINRAKRTHSFPDRIDILIDGQDVSVRIRANARALRYTLNLGIPGSEPVVTIPAGGSLRGARSFLGRHTEWLQSRLSTRPAARPFRPGRIVPIRDVKHRISHRPGVRGTVWVEDGVAMPVLAVAGEREHLERRLVDWLKQEARTDLEESVFRYARMIRVRPTAIRIRDPKGRWGSCSSRGTLSFSWRLVLAPSFVLDYLAAHEVAHLREMNHGPAFWRLVYRMCSDTDEAEAWLKAHGAGLHAIGRDDPF